VKVTTHSEHHIKNLDLWRDKLMDLFGLHVFGSENDTLPSVLVNLLANRQLKLTTAESCTGGQIASMLTGIPGASSVFEAGFVTYSNSMKSRMLGVETGTLEKYGAVSEAVVRQMALGALERSSANLSLAVSGIAGPDGGTDEKPVGTVWLAWGEKENLLSRCIHYPAPREHFQTMIAAIGIDLVRRYVLGEREVPSYIEKRSR
jgi:nicotinamide-nucleotide amidase